jgi:transcriptional regulator with XRE-family HTH domain
VTALKQTSEFIGPRIRKLREANQLSREKLADVLGLSDSYIGLIERGTRGITINNLIKIGDYFDVPVEYFISHPSHSSNLNNNPRLLEISNHIKHLADEDYQCLIKIIEEFSTHYKKK